MIRDVLTELAGTAAWGGDVDQAEESHFDIACRPGHPGLDATVRRIDATARAGVARRTRVMDG